MNCFCAELPTLSQSAVFSLGGKHPRPVPSLRRRGRDEDVAALDVQQCGGVPGIPLLVRGRKCACLFEAAVAESDDDSVEIGAIRALLWRRILLIGDELENVRRRRLAHRHDAVDHAEEELGTSGLNDRARHENVDAVLFGHTLETTREVHVVADEAPLHPVLRPDIAMKNVSCVDAHPRPDLRQALLEPLLAEGGERPLLFECGGTGDRGVRVNFVGRIPECHDCIADEFADCASARMMTADIAPRYSASRSMKVSGSSFSAMVVNPTMSLKNIVTSRGLTPSRASVCFAASMRTTSSGT
eukprot:Opistho-1_new@81585